MAVATILSPGVSVGGKYEVVEVIGFGGMGVVYKVREQVGAVSRIRALKTVLPQFASDPSVMRRFRQEAEKMCMLEHENIVPVLSYSEEGQFPYLVMPFIEGQTLKEYLAGYTAEHGRGLPLSEVMEIGLELVRGLEIAHRFVNPETRRPQPMVHRDIKPGNIMVRVETDSGERRLKVLIMDFGIAKVLSDQDSGHSLTEVIGTVKYASPEQIRRGKDIDPRADIYSLGMVLYELYAGRHMFTGLSEHAVLMRMVQRDLKDLEIPFPEGTPQRFRQFIERCVAVDPDRRFPNVGDMRAVIRRILDEDSERIVTEAAQARDQAQSARASAVEQGAEQFAARMLAEGDELLSQGDAAIADHRLKHAVPSLRAAAEAFARAAQESVEGRERDRLVRGLSALAELRGVALAAGAERLVPQSVVAATEATRVVERALEVGDLTGGGHALAQAERAWREAHDAARREELRLDAMAGCDRLEGAIAATRGELARLPAHLRDTARLADVDLAEAEAKAARRSIASADFAGASQAAAGGMARVIEVDRWRTQRLVQLVDELSERLRSRLASIDSSPDVDPTDPAHAQTHAAADAAQRLVAEGRHLDALAAFEGTLAAVEELESQIARRAAEREQALRAAEREQALRAAERDRLVRGLSGLAELRGVALAAGAERLVPQSVVAAAEATRVLERALEVGDLTGGGHALAQAERAWREAHDAARREELRLDAMAGCDRLEAAIAATRAELAPLPVQLREAAGLADVELAETRARAARASTSAGDFEGASQAAAAAMALLAEVDRRRARLLSQHVDDLSERLRSRLASIDSSPDVDPTDPAHAQTHAAADAAHRLVAEGRHLDALAAFEGTLAAVEELESQIARRAAERNRNAEPAAQEALESLRSARAAVASAGTPAGAEASELAAAVDEAARAESEFGRGEYAAALPPLRSAGKRLSDLAQAISQRIEREHILARLTSLRAEATQKTRALGALGAGALDAPQSRRLLDALASAEQHAGQGDPSEAIRILEESLPELDRRVAEARTELELKRARDEASAARERAQAALAAAERLGERATRDQRFARGRDDVDRGLELYEAERFAEAASRFAAGQHALAELGAEIEEHERVERLAALGRRRAAVVEGLGHLSTTRRTRRRLKAIRRALAAADDALAAANESEAGRRLDEIESSVGTLLEQAAAQKATAPVSGFAWRAVAIGGGAAACLVGTLVWIGRPKTPSEPKLAEALRTPPISAPTMPREPEPTVAVEARATAAPPLEPTLAPMSAPPTNAPVVEARMPPAVEATLPPVVQPTVAERPPPLVLASARPTTRTVRVRTGSEPRFDASLKNGDDRSLLWQLGGETVGRGRSIVLGKEVTGTPGRKRLDVVAVREGLPTPLRSWDLEIEAPPLGFAALEPANPSVERKPGVPVSFRAPVNLSQGEKLAFLWKVNGEPAHGATDGPAYDFQPQSPGEYVIEVRATAPWGATIANTWNLSVRPVIPTPDLKKEVDRPDPRAGAQAWIQAYCTAFEKKDVEALLTLGHLTSETEAERLRDALASMSDLKVSCTNPSIRTSGDDVVVSFDRTDRWTDPRGTTMERALPRITKHLHLANGRWVATP